jgi:cell division protein FtsQ
MLKLWLYSFWNKPAILNSLAALMLCAAISLVGMAASSWVKRHAWFDIKALVITGMRGNADLLHQNTGFIKSKIMPHLRGNFFTADLSAVQTKFKETAWLRHAEVRRVWPNRLWVILEEHQAVAKLNQDLLINAQGEPFLGLSDQASSEKWQKLPQLYGEQVDIPLIQARFQALNEWLAPTRLSVKQLSFSERRAWTAVLSNNIVLDIGRDDLQPATQQRVIRWVNTWATAQQAVNLKTGSRIDLRYPNGYAVSKGTL